MTVHVPSWWYHSRPLRNDFKCYNFVFRRRQTWRTESKFSCHNHSQTHVCVNCPCFVHSTFTSAVERVKCYESIRVQERAFEHDACTFVRSLAPDVSNLSRFVLQVDHSVQLQFFHVLTLCGCNWCNTSAVSTNTKHLSLWCSVSCVFI